MNYVNAFSILISIKFATSPTWRYPDNSYTYMASFIRSNQNDD